MSITLVYDCTTGNLSTVLGIVGPNAQLAGYDTGAGIKWTPAQFAAHPNAVHYDQDPDDSDFTSDLLDVETRAGVIARAGNWYKNSLRNFQSGTRPGQRRPSIYSSASNITAVVNGLIAQGIKSGPGLLVANWSLSEAAAIDDVTKAAGPFPIIGVQFKTDGSFDTSVMSTTWLNQRSSKPATAASIRGVVVAADMSTVPVMSTDRKVWTG